MIFSRVSSGIALTAGLSAALWVLAAEPFAVGLPAAQMDIPQILLFYGSMPRAVIALLAGALLGLSGALLQTVLRNPIADPSTLGLSSGAQLALITAAVFAPELLAFGRWPVALIGASVACAVVMGVGAARQFHPVTVVITGMLVSLFASGLATALTLSQGEYLFSLVVWSGGSLVQTDWTPALSLMAVLIAAGVASALMARPLAVLGLGAEASSGLGLPVGLIRALAVLVAAAISAAVAAAVGLVSFIGLAAPAVARALGARTSGQILWLSPLAGALILSLIDNTVMLAAGQGAEMFPTGAVTGLIGGPLILFLLPRLRSAPLAEPSHPPFRLTLPARVLAGIAAALALAVLVALMLGRSPGGWWWLSWQDTAAFLPARAPRLIGAAAAGGLLAMSGAILQRLTANPLAAPEVLGVSGGAAIGYAGVMFAMAAPAAWMMQAGAATGGAVALTIIATYALSRDMRPERVLLAGISVSAFAAAILSALMAGGTMKSFLVMAWLSGASASLTLTGAALLVALLLALWAAGLLAGRWLAILPLGPQTARALGLDLRVAWGGLVLLAGLATGVATILAGPLSFVGLMAPHLAHRCGFATARVHLLASILIGALIMVVADFGARMATFPYDLPPGLFAALIGAPWLVWLMLRRPA